MKWIFVFFTFILSILSAQAATFSPVNELSDERLSDLVGIHEESSSIFNGCSSTLPLTLESMQMKEKWLSVIKQALKKYHVPSRGLRVEEVEMTSIAIRKTLVKSAFDNVSTQTLNSSERRLIRNFEGILSLIDRDARFFTGDFSNNTMRASFLVIMDLVQMELVIFASGQCHAG